MYTSTQKTLGTILAVAFGIACGFAAFEVAELVDLSNRTFTYGEALSLTLAFGVLLFGGIGGAFAAVMKRFGLL